MKKINNKLQLPNSKTAVRWIKNILPVSFIPFTVKGLNAKTVLTNIGDTVYLSTSDTTVVVGNLCNPQGAESDISVIAIVFYCIIGSLVMLFLLRTIQHLCSRSADNRKK